MLPEKIKKTRVYFFQRHYLCKAASPDYTLMEIKPQCHFHLSNSIAGLQISPGSVLTDVNEGH